MSRIFKVFIASPNDVRKERNLLKRAIEELTPKLVRLYGCALVRVSWDDFAAITPPSEALRPQDMITHSVRESGIFIGILHKHYGTPAHPPKRASGTDEEFRVALERRGSIRIMSYFRRLSASEKRNPEVKKVQRLRLRLQKVGVVPKEYNSRESFLPLVILDLLEVVVGSLPESQHREELARFFRFGIGNKQSDSHVMICYPPIHKHDPKGAPGRYNWHKRLVPNVVFEDMKAIQKLEDCVHRLGVREVKSVTTSSVTELYAPDHNRIWLCLPRNSDAQARLNCYRNELRFKLCGVGTGNHYLSWDKGSGKWVTIHSPLAKYLLKRGARARNSPWQESFGNIVARDYAVIARFQYKGDDQGRAQDAYPFWEYFIFGIRGLGTWGASWFIYNKPRELAGIVERQGDKNIQCLLQVTFDRHRIVEVLDVSDKPQKYFNDQSRQATINKLSRQNGPD